MADLAYPDEYELLAREEFLGLVKRGVGHTNAAISVGWTPAKLRRLMKDMEFAEMVAEMRLSMIESIEEKEVELALRGNQRAIEMILFCQAGDRGWHPPTQRIDVRRTDKLEVSLVSSTVEAVRQLMASSDPAELQPGGILDAEIIDEV